MITYTEEQAQEMGYVSITTPYSHSEKEFFDRAVKQMEGADYLIVLDRLKRPEIYRKKTDLKLLNEGKF